VDAARLLQVAKHFQIQNLVDKAIDKLEGLLNNVKALTEVLSEVVSLEFQELKNFVVDCICW
jgi:hypothetical protein